jgi:hypothetical protein
MSDISLTFPPWMSFALVGLVYGWLIVPVGVGLGLTGWFGKALPRPVRWVALGGAGLCAAPYGLLLVLFVAGGVDKARQASDERARHRTLTTAEMIEGLTVPAGAVLAYSDKTQKTLVSVDLPRPMSVAGLTLEGSLAPVGGREWDGALASDAVVGGWPCAAGDIWFTPNGAVTRCVLSKPAKLAGYDLPAGATSRHDPASGGWEFQLAVDGPAMRVPALGAELPPAGLMVLDREGALRRVYAPHESPMVIAGVALNDHIILDGGAVTGLLAKPARDRAGVMLEAQTVVNVDLATGAIERASRPSVIAP